MRDFVRFGNICIIKKRENTLEGVILSVKLQTDVCNFIKSIAPPSLFFTFFKILQMVPNRAKDLI